MKKLLALALTLILALTLLSGCGNNDNQNNGTADTDTLVVGLSSEPLTLDPSMASDSTSAMLCLNLYDPLIRRNSEGELVPALAESWEIAPDGMSVTLKLREGVKFQNGYDFTADDVVFTFERTLAQPGSALFADICSGAEKIDEYTVKLNLVYPEQAILQYLTRANDIMSKQYFEEVGEDGYAAAPIGTGPYKLVEWQKGSKLVLERYDDYYLGAAPIKNVEVRILKESSTLLMALETGDVDVIYTLTGLDIENVKSNPDLAYHETNGTTIWSIAFNTEKEPFNNAKVRQALAMAINREDILLAAANNAGNTLSIILPPQTIGNPGEDTIDILPYDPEGAKALLAEAGYPDGFDMTITVREDTTKKMGTVLQDEWKELGINVEMEVLERGALISDMRSGLLDCYPMGNVDMTTDASLLLGVMTTENIPALNNSFYSNPEYDALYVEQSLETDPEKRQEIIREMLNIAAQDVPMVPIYSPVTNLACNKNLNVTLDPSFDGIFWYEYSWNEG